MNIQILRKYISDYKQEFEYIGKQEIYKWKAVKHFKDNWDIDAGNFPLMLNKSIKKTVNLLKSGQYFPLRMINNYAEREPETVRKLFRNLYDEKTDIEKRIKDFQDGTEALNKRFYPDKKHTYQDLRAVAVYLTLKYPEIYYLYKFRMFETFTQKLDLTFKPVAGEISTLKQYNKVCSIIQHNIAKDQELLRLHQARLTSDCYIDEQLHILTQDFIYAVVEYLGKHEQPHIISKSIAEAPIIKADELVFENNTINLEGRFVNFIENSIEAKRIGDLGEDWVFNQEIKKLKENRLIKLSKKVRFTSNDEGDGTGYDIESYDLKGNKIYIEVKTTKNRFNTTFFITRNELERSRKEKENYYIYRVYDFKEETNQAECIIIQGDLTPLCGVPVNYKVNIKTR